MVNMGIVLVRIDDRLIHGQVVVEWAPSLKTSVIIVADNEIEHNRFRQDLIKAMKLAVPPNINVEIYNVARMVEKFLHNELPKGNIIILFSTLEDFKQSLDFGFTTPEINLGCVHSGDIELASNITIKKEEVLCLEDIRKNGIHIDLRAIPRSKQVEIETISIYKKLIEESGEEG